MYKFINMKSIAFFCIIYNFVNLINHNNNIVDKSLYYSTSFPWYIFYDPTNNKNCDIIEIGGIKYGFIDKLNKVNRNDTISRSTHGVLYKKKKILLYYNYELKKEFKLNNVKYKPSFSAKRSKIFNTYAFSEVKKYALQDADRSQVYEIITDDFEAFENNKNKNCSPFDFETFLQKLN